MVASSPHAQSGTVWTVTNGIFSSNCYIGATEVRDECILIDPGLGGERIDARLCELSLRPRFVFCTHGHFDHCGSASLFQRKYGIPVFMHAADQKTMQSSNFLLMALKIPARVIMPEVTFIRPEDFFMDIGGHALRYLEVPGHTPGSCLIEWGPSIFSGDTMYARGVGLSALPGEDHAMLRSSILRYWDTLPKDSIIYPGHGESATFGEVRAGNASLLAFLGFTGAKRETI
jgi:glyoxylase-like metal-dependent hydrolase (beta-lactamase superfamily II)